MKKNIFILLSILSVYLMGGQLYAATQTVRVLAIGNSFSQDAVEQYLYELGVAEDINFIIGNVYYGGCSLESHSSFAANNSAVYSYRKIVNGARTTTEYQTLESCVTDETWDFISFQQASQYSGIYSTYFPYLNNLLTYVKAKVTNPSVVYMLHQTWAYAQNSTHSGFPYYNNNQQQMYNAIISATSRVKEEVSDITFVIPAGTAIQNGRTSGLGDTFCSDGYHLDPYIGRYTAACTWFEKITGKNVLNNTYKPNIGDFQINVTRNAAHYAVQTPNSVTSMAEFIFDNEENTRDLKNPVNISFGNAVTATGWNSVISFKNGVILGLKDTQGNDTGIAIEVNDAFGGINSNGPTSTNTVLNMPSEVSNNSFYGCAVAFGEVLEPTGGFRVSHLNKQYTYNFKMFASRTATDGNNRETHFTVKGVNEAVAAVNASSNTELAEVSAIQPTATGEINIEVKPGQNNNNGNKFFYINALQITGTPVSNSVKENKVHAFSMYPNPVINTAYIQTDTRLSDIAVYNLTGQKIKNLDELDESNMLDFRFLNKGVYVLKTSKGSVSFVKN